MDSAIRDCEDNLAAVRARLLCIKDELAQNSTPTDTTDSQIVQRNKIRLKGFVHPNDETDVIPSTSKQRRLRRASISSQADSVRDRIIRTFNLSHKRGLEMLRENGYCRTPEQTARFFLTTSGLKKESIGNALGSMTDERGLESLKLFAEGIGMEGLPFVRSLRKVSERSGAGGGGLKETNNLMSHAN